MSLVIAFLGGLAGSMHCVGMCGIFPLSLAAASGARVANWRRQLLYQFGRLNTLAVLGVVAGGAGAAFLHGAAFGAGERALALITGALMIVIGLEQLGWLTQLSTRGAAAVRTLVGGALAGVLRSRSAAAPLALGVFNAFLPCQLIYAFAAEAAATASLARGGLVMLAFGAGTVPAMLALGVAPSLLSARARAAIARGGALLVIAWGLLTISRGIWAHQHGG